MIDAPPSTPQQEVIAQKLVACGLDRNFILVTWQNDLQSMEIVIRRDAHASADQFVCIQHAAATEIVTFEDQSLQAAYTYYTVELYRPRMIADATAAVTKLGLIKGFPRRSDYDVLSHYTAALERRCGLAAHSVLHVSDDAVTFDPPREPNFKNFQQWYAKILAAVMYAQAIGDLGKFGFIGNEAFANPDK